MHGWSLDKSLKRPRGAFLRRSRSGFTLIEILIVGAIISLFAGLALFSIQTMYDETKRKAMFDEVRSIGTAIGIAHNDIGMYPRMNVLGTDLGHMTYAQGTQTLLRPGLDVYGHPVSISKINDFMHNWRAPYTAVTEVRRSFSQGTHLLVKMRLPDTDVNSFPTNGPLGNIAYVDWPSDVWGNPYVLYAVKADPTFVSTTFNPQGWRLVDSSSESPDWVAVVSYGPNHIPGGTDVDLNVAVGKDPNYQPFVDNVLTPARLYIPGDSVTGTTANPPQAVFTLKSFAQGATGDLNLGSSQFLQVLGRSINSGGTVSGQVGMRDEGSDDIWWTF